jgi:tRNA A-37 threonylcarbamoyl transferase component Bud32
VTITPQTSLDERYLLLRRLAFGGMGEVWEGSDVVLDRAVAVKILRAELADDDAFRRRFRAEARTAGRVPHPGIASVYDYGETSVDGKGLAYLVMELVPGEPLSAILAREGALGTDRTLDVVAQSARALHAAHERGVIHRDVKPANLMVTPDGRVKVTDFGIARPDDHEPLTATGQVMGTAHYLAPELARGRAATPASDIYALGVVMYECLAGRRPFEGDDQIGVATAHLAEEPPPLPGTIAPEVRALVAAAMEKDPQRRIGGAEVFAAAAEGLRLRGHTGSTPYAGDGYAADGSGAAATAFVLGAGAAGAIAPAAEAFARPVTPAPWPSTPHPGAPLPPSGAVPAPGSAAASGALLSGGPLLSGGTPPGDQDLFERSPTAALPIPGGPGTGGVRRGRRSPSLPLIALVALVLLVIVGTVIAALRSQDPGSAPTPSVTQSPVPTSGRPPGKATPTTSRGPATGSTSGSGRPTTSSSKRSATSAPTGSRTATPTASAVRPSPSASPPPSSPAASGSTSTDPSPSPTPTDSPPAQGAGGEIGGEIGGDPGSGPGSGSGNSGGTALRKSPAAAPTVDTGESGSTT